MIQDGCEKREAEVVKGCEEEIEVAAPLTCLSIGRPVDVSDNVQSIVSDRAAM